jgi:hypothetical protein
MFPVLANEAVATVCLAYSIVLASVYKNTVLRLHTYGIRYRCGGQRSTPMIPVGKPEGERPF